MKRFLLVLLLLMPSSLLGQCSNVTSTPIGNGVNCYGSDASTIFTNGATAGWTTSKNTASPYSDGANKGVLVTLNNCLDSNCSTSGVSITSCAISSNVATLVTSNHWDSTTGAVGGKTKVFGFTGGCNFLNGQTLTVVSASTTQFTANFTHANLSTTTDTGIAQEYITISDNVNNPETCFVLSPNSPQYQVETSLGAQHIQSFIWFCPNLSASVTDITITCSLPSNCSYSSGIITAFTGLPSSGTVIDTDCSAASTTKQTSLSFTCGARRYTKEIPVAFIGTSADELQTPGSGWIETGQPAQGVFGEAQASTGAGTFTVTSSWTASDDWFGAAVSLITNQSVAVGMGTAMPLILGSLLPRGPYER